MLLSFVASAHASEGQWGDWDAAPRKSFFDLGTVGAEVLDGNCSAVWKYSRLVSATVDAGLRCALPTNVALEIAPQLSWDGSATRLSKVVPGLRVKAIGNFEATGFDNAVLGIAASYVLTPKVRREAWDKPGFKYQSMKRWMDIWDSHISLAWMQRSRGAPEGWLFEFKQSLFEELRFAGIGETAATEFVSASVARMWWKGSFTLSAGLGAYSVRIENIRISFLGPNAGIAYQF